METVIRPLGILECHKTCGKLEVHTVTTGVITLRGNEVLSHRAGFCVVSEQVVPLIHF